MNDIIATFNGQDIALHQLFVPVQDRAYMFGDAVYEVLRVYHRKPFLLREHMARLSSSLSAMGMAPLNLTELILHNIAINDTVDGMVYVQISRGESGRSHSFHQLALTPNILVYTKKFLEHPSRCDQQSGIRAVTHDDVRWSHCHIKTTNLLANCLIQTHAHKQGAAEAIFVRDGLLTEGTSSNVFLVVDNCYVTPPLSKHILAGTRRQFLVDQLQMHGKAVIERPVSKAELFHAHEIFITSTVREVVSVVQVDQHHVGDGKVGSYALFAQNLINNALSATS